MSFQVGAHPLAKNVSNLRAATTGSDEYQYGDGGFARPDARDERVCVVLQVLDLRPNAVARRREGRALRAAVAPAEPGEVVVGRGVEAAGLDDRLREGEIAAHAFGCPLFDVDLREIVDRGLDPGAVSLRADPSGHLVGGEHRRALHRLAARPQRADGLGALERGVRSRDLAVQLGLLRSELGLELGELTLLLGERVLLGLELRLGLRELRGGGLELGHVLVVATRGGVSQDAAAGSLQRRRDRDRPVDRGRPAVRVQRRGALAHDLAQVIGLRLQARDLQLETRHLGLHRGDPRLDLGLARPGRLEALVGGVRRGLGLLDLGPRLLDLGVEGIRLRAGRDRRREERGGHEHDREHGDRGARRARAAPGGTGGTASREPTG